MSGHDAPPQPASGPTKHRRRRLLPAILVGVAVLLVAAMGVGAFYAVSIDRSVTKNIQRADNLPAETPTASGEAPRPDVDTAAEGALNFVLLGSDSRDTAASGNGRSDTIIVAHLNKERDKAYLISFPRDMYVNVPGYGKNKINAAFAFGGPALTVSTLEDLTGARMDSVVLVDFEGFVQLTEDLGGVTVSNDNAFSAHGFDYPKGEITVSGEEALWFVRERKSLPDGDLDRAANQRKVVQAIVSKGLSAEVVRDPAKFTGFLAGLAKHLVVDESLSDADIRSTAVSLRLDARDITSLQAPISGFSTTPDGQSVDVVDEAKMKALGAAIRTDQLERYLKTYPQK